ncbi:hypothetical protein MTR_3g108650 [Medicago truncatula]|uniref:Uncharacterized protein n=1 Tax=Medicago truncatula TaxID=3880 RepID=G7JCB6_MEDTR|nr:hypothetical protein MTR_3g108650 [Medicago truncatula]
MLNHWRESLEDDMEERGDECFQHVEPANRWTNDEFSLEETGACVTRADSGKWSGWNMRKKMSRIVPEDFKGEGEKVLHLMAQTGAWFLGKHRMKVAISNLNNQIDIIQVNPPLYAISKTRGQVDASWDRWFEGCNHNSTSHNRWIHS